VGTKIPILEVLLKTQDLSSIRLYAEGVTLPQRYGHAIAQAVSCWLSTAAAWVQVYVGFVVDKVALGQVFSKYFNFFCQFSFH
jgi:hypothetical protein